MSHLFTKFATTDQATIYSTFQTGDQGLSSTAAAQKLLKQGLNSLPRAARKSLLSILISQFSSALMWLLVIAAIVSFVLHQYEDGVFIVFVLVVNSSIGTYQEYRAAQILADLSTLAHPKTKVRRDGVVRLIDADRLVPGDVIILEAGNHIPADGRLIVSNALAVNESTLTGESLPVDKNNEVLREPQSLLHARNCVFMGTTVTNGRGEAVIFGTGTETELGQIAQDLKIVESPKTPLEEQVISFSRHILVILAVLISIMFVLGVIEGDGLTNMFLTSVSLAVAAIPESLPVLVTIVMVFGIKKMASEKSLVQKQTAIQTLGQVQILVTDKTGTLTENVLQVSAVCLPNKKSFANYDLEHLSPFTVGLKPVLNASLLSNNASSINHPSAADDPVDVALLKFANPLNTTSNLHDRYPRHFEIPFSSDLKLMATFHRKGSSNTQIYLKGAAREIATLCGTVNGPHKLRQFTSSQKKTFLTLINQQAAKGDKVIATAEAVLPTNVLQRSSWQIRPLLKLIKGQATLTGALFLADHIRSQAAQTIEEARQAGVRIVMATGDNRAVAATIGKLIGLGGAVVTDLPESAAARWPIQKQTDIYAEINPHTKLDLVSTWQQHGYVVAMTGDGVNDAPALKKADVGLAMGKRGTDIAKDTADIIMLDDNITTIVKAIASGRTIFRNIQKVIAYLLACNAAEVLVLFLAIISGGLLPLPLLPAQILWVNLITDGLTVIPLALEPDHSDIMKQPPRKRRDPLLSPLIVSNIIWVSITITILTLASFSLVWFTTHDLTAARTAAFFVLATTEIFNILSARSAKTSFFKLGAGTNPAVILAVIGSLIIQIAILYLPITKEYLKLSTLPLWLIMALILVSSLVFWLLELKKHLATTSQN